MSRSTRNSFLTSLQSLGCRWSSHKWIFKIRRHFILLDGDWKARSCFVLYGSQWNNVKRNPFNNEVNNMQVWRVFQTRNRKTEIFPMHQMTVTNKGLACLGKQNGRNQITNKCDNGWTFNRCDSHISIGGNLKTEMFQNNLETVADVKH